MRLFFLLKTILLTLGLMMTSVAAQSLQMGVSVDVVPVGSDFDGQDIVIFGSIEDAEIEELYRGKYDVVVEVIGDNEEVLVRKKDRVGGIWINTNARKYIDVPSFYSVMSRNELKDVSNPLALRTLGLGIENIRARPQEQGSVQQFLTASEFSQALRRVRIQDGLFYQSSDALEQLSPSLYRATLSLPPNAPIGLYVVKAHLFYEGKKMADVASSFEVRKIGFERWIYDFAHNQSLFYGFMCVFIAMFTGWAANAIFRKA
ncbi:MAG: TIGR02186 family protein [Pseudomonadota bacterium]